MPYDEGETAAEVAPQHEVEQGSPSVDDTLRQTLDEISKRGDDVAGDAPKTVSRQRSADGRFAPKEPASTEAPAEEGAEGNQEAPPAEEPATTPAPNTWRKDVAARWTELPPDVQSEVLRREADFHKGIEQYRTKAAFGDAIERAISPYAATLHSLGIGPDRAVAELMAADHRLRHGSQQDKTQYFASLAQNYGIDLGQVAELSQATPPAIDPHYAALQQELRQVRGMVESRTQAEQRREQEALHSEILRFAADPSHSHFEQVKNYMAALLQAGQAENLQDAYEQAIYANPATRQVLLQQQVEKARKESAAKAEAARKAAGVHVRSRPSVPTTAPIGTIEETLRAELARLSA